MSGEIGAATGAWRNAGFIDRDALNRHLLEQGGTFARALSEQHDHLFADVALCITTDELAQMRAVIAAVEDVGASLPAKEIREQARSRDGSSGSGCNQHSALGVFYGYDFHLNAQGAHLIEINSNAGGAFLNALLIDSQRDAALPGASPVHASTGLARTEIDLGAEFTAMFRNEWRLTRGDAPLDTIAIVDERPATQYLYPEFLLAQSLLERAGIAAYIADPSELQARGDGLYVDEQRVDLIYNRLTDFSLQQYPHLLAAYEKRLVVLTPNPVHYQRYADKRKLVSLSDGQYLQAAGVSQTSMDALLRGVPQTRLVCAEDAEQWWAERKQWFFKPANGYGSKGAYRGDKVTKRVFEEIMRSDYVAQRLAIPGECVVAGEDGEPQALKYDVRCYVYDGRIQLVAARLYQGQTTNFRTPGGGFALVRVAGD